MKDAGKTKEQLIAELADLRVRVADLEKRESLRRVIEAELLRNRELLHTAQEIAHLGSWELDLVDNVITWSDEVYRIFGLQPREFGATYEAFLDTVHPDDRTAVDAAYTGSLREGRDTYEIEHRIVRKDTGEVRVVHEKCIHYRDAVGRLVRSTGVVQDITDQKKTEQALRRSESFARAIVENEPACIKIVGSDGLLRYMNPAGLAMLEAENLEAVRGRPLESFAVAEHLEAIQNLAEKVLKGEEGRLQFEVTGMKGTRRWLDTHAVPMRDEQGVVDAILGVTRDITDSKMIENFQFFLAQSGGDVRRGDFFNSLAAYLAEKLETDMVCIDRLAEGNHAATTLALYFDGKFEDNLTYTLKDTPCGDVVANRVCYIQSGVCELFPHDQVLQDMKAESYAGTILWDHQRNPIGLIALIWRKPLQNFEMIESLLQLAGVRAAGELERKLAEDQVIESKRMLQAVLDTIPVRVFWKDLNSIFLGCNKPFALDAGLSTPDELLGKDDYAMGWRDQADLYRADDRRVMDSDIAKLNFEEPQTTPDGRKITLRTSKIPLKDAGGRVYGVLGTYEDITERKQAENQLNVLSTAIEQSPASIVITDVAGNIEYVNPKFTRLTGYSFEEARGQNPRILKSGVQPPEVYDELWQTITAGNIWRGEFCNKNKSGDLYWEGVIISPVKDEAGAITHYLAVKEDITERKKSEEVKKGLEAQLRQAQKMETIGTLAGGIAHDFNNIIQPVSSCAELLRSRLPVDSPMLKYVDLMARSVDRGRDLVKQLLTFSRQREHERRPMRLQPVVNETIRMVQSVMPATVDIRLKVDPGCSSVMADAVQVQQVIMNLCTNACDAMNKNGVLMVRLEETALDEAAAGAHMRLKPGRYARITVEDTGHGMDAETQKRIFDPFFTTKEVGKGTGLGLSVVHGIVTESGGEITVESVPGKGTTFAVYLPCCENAATDENVGADGMIRKGRGSILFVDDEEDIVDIVREMLADLGYSVTAMTGNLEALEEFRQNPAGYDLVISDYSMPRMSGVKFAAEVLNVRPDMPVILISGNNEAIPAEKLKEAAIREVVSKPFRLNEIGEAISRALNPSQ